MIRILLKTGASLLKSRRSTFYSLLRVTLITYIHTLHIKLVVHNFQDSGAGAPADDEDTTKTCKR